MPNGDEMVNQEIRELREGDSFGELALLDDSYRTATCYAKSDCDLAYLEK